MLREQKEEELQSGVNPFTQREGTVLLICDSTGRIGKHLMM